MSREKHKEQAQRWLSQAGSDLHAAAASRAAGSCEWACFQAQQGAEKALKALWMHLGEDPWGHSVMKLLADLPDAALRATLLRDLGAAARDLDKLYVPTRYPNGLPDLTPHDVFADADADDAMQKADLIIARVRHLTSS